VVVGAISPHPARPVIEDPQVAAFAEAAAADGSGLVLVSFGSVGDLFGAQLDGTDYTNLALAFADLAPTRVLWALKPGGLPSNVSLASLPLGNNTLVLPWVPTNDVLGHPSCRAFVTHAGACDPRRRSALRLPPQGPWWAGLSWGAAVVARPGAPGMPARVSQPPFSLQP
jgi:hypothetical protein